VKGQISNGKTLTSEAEQSTELVIDRIDSVLPWNRSLELKGTAHIAFLHKIGASPENLLSH